MSSRTEGPVDRVLALLEGVKAAGKDKWRAKCPAHDDKRPSLSVTVGDDGRVLLHCHAGCLVEEICSALGIRQKDLFPPQRSRGPRRITARYAYRNEEGEVLFEVVRKRGKGFFQRRPAKKGGWVNGLKGVRRVLYNLPQLTTRDDETVFVVEGEKDADRLIGLGFLATTNPCGAGKWRPEYGEVLAGRHAVVLPDNDEPGRKHAVQVAESLHGVAASVKVVELPGLPEKGDVSDWLDAGHDADELRGLVERTGPWEPSAEGEAPDDADAEQETGRHASRLVRLVQGQDIDLFHDERQEAYAAMRFPEGRRVLRLKSDDFGNWLSRLAWEGLHEAFGREVLAAATRVLSGIARYEGPEHSLNVRCARHEDAVWLDLDGVKAVKVTPEGWDVVPEPRILFRSYAHQRPLHEPTRGGDLSRVLDFVNIRGEDARLLFLCYLVAAVVPEIPVAALLVHGVQGSAKTTLLKVVKRLLDPSAVEVRGSVRDPAEYAQAACQNRVLFFDNLTKVRDWLSDALCRTVTGEGYSKRTLYTDEDTTVFEYKRVVGLCGINLVGDRADLLDRSIILELDPISPGQRKEESAFWSEFKEALPGMLGGLLDALAEAMRVAPNLELPELPRMADFARWGAAAAVALGREAKDFLDAYRANVARQNEAAVDASPVAQAVLALMEDESEWEGTPTKLLEDLNIVATGLGLNTNAKYWPGSPTWVARRIREVQPNLLAMGVEVSEDRTARRRVIALRKVGGDSVTVVTSVTEGPESDGSVTGDASPDDGPVTADDAGEGVDDDDDDSDGTGAARRAAGEARPPRAAEQAGRTVPPVDNRSIAQRCLDGS